MKNVAHYGHWSKVDSIHARGAPWFKPCVVGDIVAQDTFVFAGNIRFVSVQGNISEEGRGYPVGRVIASAGPRGPVEYCNSPIFQRSNDNIVVNIHT